MKKTVFAILMMVVLASCHNYKKDAQQLTMERDSIAQQSEIKDSTIVGYLSDFNEILARLDSIKTVEKQVTVNTSPRREMTTSRKKMILEDVELLNELIQKNKEQIAALQRKLNSANAKVGKLNTTLAELETLVQALEKQIHEKDTEIERLNASVQSLTRNVNQLNEKIAVIETDSQQKSSTIEKQTKELNKAYYIIGSAKELEQSGVIDRSGGFLGIGKTSVVQEELNKDVFTTIDIRKFAQLPLNTKKVQIVTVHPAGSFHITGEKSADTLFIDNKSEFWSVSKYLVIVTK